MSAEIVLKQLLSAIMRRMQESDYLSQTRLWIQEFVVGLNLCPFAAPVLSRDAWRLRTIEGGVEACLSAVAKECQYLEAATELDTSVLVLSTHFNSFDDFWDLIDLVEQLLDSLEYAGIFQIASFHPQYLFEGSDSDAVENYTNRSPAPIVQILRESSVTRGLAQIDEPDAIVERNIQTLQELGLSEVKKRLRKIRV